MVVSVKLTANFERNLETIAGFLDKLDAQEAYDRLLDELNDTLIPNLERFPSMGRLFLERTVRSVEVENALSRLRVKLAGSPLREYLFSDYLVLYAQLGQVIYLLSIKHHRQLSFDF
jgi:plasmid stabilization system protein ParE